METLIDEMNMAVLDREAAQRVIPKNLSLKFGCTHKHEYLTGAEKDCNYLLYTVHFYEYACPDCNKCYWLPWLPWLPEKDHE